MCGVIQRQEWEGGHGGLRVGPGVRWEEGPGDQRGRIEGVNILPLLGCRAGLHFLFPTVSTLWSP